MIYIYYVSRRKVYAVLVGIHTNHWKSFILLVVGGSHRAVGRRDYPHYAGFEWIVVVCGYGSFFYGCRIVQLLQK